MSIKKYIAEKDTTITDAYLENLSTRAYTANMGESDSLEMFSIYGQTSSSVEKSRILVQFPISEIASDREKSAIPNAGNVKFYLKMYNVKHPFSLPKDYNAVVSVLSCSWDEGYGLDMESYLDQGWNDQQKTGFGATWTSPGSGSTWQGGSVLADEQYNLPVYFKTGEEDIELDITDIVEDWVNEAIPNNGLLIRLSGSYEDGSRYNSFYTKKFSARGSQFFYKRPSIEARWEAISTDDRNNFYASSSALSPEDNKMNIYFYNKVNGTLKNIYNDVLPGLKLYSDTSGINEITASYKSITNPAAGIYRAQISVDTTASVLYDNWYNTSSFDIYFRSSFDVLNRQNYDFNNSEEYIVNITNNKLNYTNFESSRFNIFVREKDWKPTIYTVAYNTIENTSLVDLYYKIFRLNDNYTVLDYSTGSLAYTKTSYDSNGNYFDLDMSILEPGYTYGIKLARWNGIQLKEFKDTFKFKVG